jgi:cathepsin A (carboxypeptidase C)
MRGLNVVLLAAAAVVALPSGDVIVPEEDFSETAPQAEPENNWSGMQQRQAIWQKIAPTLARADKDMHKALQAELHDPHSIQWARYYRHQNLVQKKNTAPGHNWVSHTGEKRSGILLETSKAKAAMDAHAKGLSLCDPKVKQHHGYFNIDKMDKKSNKGQKNYFYWFFESREDPENAPTIMWLTGGPGCSSMLALLGENGPCTVNKDGATTKLNPQSWNKKANILFVDQPSGTGFSYGDSDSYDSNEKEVSQDLYNFIQELMKVHPKYHKNDFYIFGESYAGHFVPAAAQAVFMGNKNTNNEYIALRGIGIGNGLTDPEIQYKYYPEMAFKPGTAPAAVDKSTYEEMKSAVPICISAIKNCEKTNSLDVCSEAMANCNMALIQPVQMGGINQYDMREQCKEPPLCYNFDAIQSFLNSPATQKILGTNRDWESCNFSVNGQFQGDWMKNYAKHIPDMLANGHSVMIYAGDVDFICNYKGNKAWTKAMKWPHQKAYNAAEDKDWKVDGKVSGKVRHANGLTFVQIHKAGHMVPMDQPKVAVSMLDQFLAHKTLLVDP